MIKNKVIVFYDAYCVLCDSSIIWLIENDKNNILQFSHFKSDFALSKIKNSENSDTVSILTSNGEILQKSDAVIFLLTLLKDKGKQESLSQNIMCLRSIYTQRKYVAEKATL